MTDNPTTASELAASDHIATFEELKRRTPDYMGAAPKAQHYQRIHAAYDAAIAALREREAPGDVGGMVERCAVLAEVLDLQGNPKMAATARKAAGALASRDAEIAELRAVSDQFNGIIEDRHAELASLKRELAEAGRLMDAVLASSGARGRYHAFEHRDAVDAAEAFLARNPDASPDGEGTDG